MRRRRTDARWRQHLLFPLRIDVLVAQLLIFGIGAALYLSRHYWMQGNENLPNVLAIVDWTGVTLFLTLLVEYGFSIIAATVEEKPRIPMFTAGFLTRQFGGDLADILENLNDSMGLKLVRQQAVVMAFLGLAWWLAGHDLGFLALLLMLLFSLVLPASLAINAMSGRVLALVHPGMLGRFIREQGPVYSACVVSLLFAVWLYALALSGDTRTFLLCLPLAVYCSLLMFRLLGDCLLANKDRYFPLADFRAGSRELASLSARREFLDRKLRQILELVKNHQVEQACRELEHFMTSNDWHYFHDVFQAASGWHDPAPAITVATGYLPHALARKEYMQALSLCEWCVKTRRDFTLHDGDMLMTLADQAASESQYRVMLKLLENFADSYPAHARPQLEKAALLAGTRLNDEKRLAAIVAKMK